MELARELTGFREYVCGSGRLGGKSSKIAAGTVVDACGPPLKDGSGSPIRLVRAAGHYVWTGSEDLVDDGPASPPSFLEEAAERIAAWRSKRQIPSKV